MRRGASLLKAPSSSAAAGLGSEGQSGELLTLNEYGIESRPQLLAPLHDLSGVLKVTDYLGHS